MTPLTRTAALAGTVALPVLLWLATAGSAVAELTAQSAERLAEAAAAASVNGHAPPDDFDVGQSAILGSFSYNALASVVADNGAEPLDRAEAIGRAEQSSFIQRKSVEAFGETHGFFGVDTLSGGGAHADGASELLYEFTIDAETSYEVLGLVDAFGAVSDGSLELVLNGTTQIFAIGEAAGYAQVTIEQSGVLQAGDYQLVALADTIHSIVGPSGAGPDTAGAEFEFGFYLDVIAPGEIVNGRFQIVESTTNRIFRWTSINPTPFQLVAVNDDVRVVFESGAAHELTQELDTPASPFFVEFDYRFLSVEGVFELLLDGVSVAELTAPPIVEASLQHVRVFVNNPLLGSLVGTPLTFAFDGPSAGLQLELDNVLISPGFAADFDRDGDVDGDDLEEWMAEFGADDGADADGDGDSDGTDFLVWQRQLGSGTPAIALNAVPEPASAITALVAMISFGGVACRNHKNRFNTSSGAAA